MMQVSDSSCRAEQQLHVTEVVDSGPTPPLKHPTFASDKRRQVVYLPPSPRPLSKHAAAAAVATAVYICCAALNTFVLPECFIY